VSETIGQRLAKIRTERGLSQQQAAAVSGVSQQAISSIERDVKSPGLDTLRLLARGYDLPAGQLVADIVGDDVTIPPGLARLVDSGLGGDVTPEEIRRLSRAQVVLGAELEPSDFLALLSRVRSASPK
jgi:transcriptional regulator with XRE-family HTH domain